MVKIDIHARTTIVRVAIDIPRAFRACGSPISRTHRVGIIEHIHSHSKTHRQPHTSLTRFPRFRLLVFLLILHLLFSSHSTRFLAQQRHQRRWCDRSPEVIHRQIQPHFRREAVLVQLEVPKRQELVFVQLEVHWNRN